MSINPESPALYQGLLALSKDLPKPELIDTEVMVKREKEAAQLLAVISHPSFALAIADHHGWGDTNPMINLGDYDRDDTKNCVTLLLSLKRYQHGNRIPPELAIIEEIEDPSSSIRENNLSDRSPEYRTTHTTEEYDCGRISYHHTATRTLSIPKELALCHGSHLVDIVKALHKQLNPRIK